MATTKDPLKQIEEHEAAIQALRKEALESLKDKRKALVADLADLDAQIEKLGGKASSAGKPSGTRNRTTIEAIVEAIKSGKTKQGDIADALNVGKQTVAGMIKKQGKAAGIVSEGSRRSLEYGIDPKKK